MFLLQDLLGDNGVLIFPTFVSSAYYSNETYPNIFNFMYLTVANVLGIPATHCTMGLDKQGLPVGLQVSNLYSVPVKFKRQSNDISHAPF